MNCPTCTHISHTPHMCITQHPHTHVVCGCRTGMPKADETGTPTRGTMSLEQMAQQEGTAQQANGIDAAGTAWYKLPTPTPPHIDIRAPQGIPNYRSSLLYLLFHLQDFSTAHAKYTERRDAVIAWLRDELES